ncbi:MAG: D-alanine--D-alanine ligase [Oscillospiraceae bacterium]|nr:D-alanine--D-alanine ligase [Oscillospiraceae bacterium]
MKIVVLAGGLSTERNISLASGTKVCAALRNRGHQAVLVDLYLGTEQIDVPAEQLFDNLPPLKPVQFTGVAPDLETVRASRKWQDKSVFGPGVLALCRQADAVFLALHGECGEDGRIQAAFDLLGIPYTGSGYRGSAIAMDKRLTKELMQVHGIRTPAWKTFRGTVADIPAIAAEVRVPCVVKIPRGGSSLGVVIVKAREELEPALQTCLSMDSTILVEQYIEGRELTCGVLGEQGLPSVEIATADYSYTNKYSGQTVEICPGRVTPEIEAEMRNTALAVHKMLGLSTYSRCDFMVTDGGEVYCLECNTLPGMTDTSLLPQEAAAVGISYEELCERIVLDALNRDSVL